MSDISARGTKDGTTFDSKAFLANHAQHRARIREQSESVCPSLLTAHQLAFSAIVSYQRRIQGKHFESSDPSSNGRMTLIAQFVQGIDLAETAISEGLYAQAANLLKQELECLAAIEEYETGKRSEGETPNPRDGLKKFGRIYGALNDVAHPSRSNVVAFLSTFESGDRTGPTTIPQFNPELYREMYGLHTTLLVKLFRYERNVFADKLGVKPDDFEAGLIKTAIRILDDLRPVSSPKLR